MALAVASVVAVVLVVALLFLARRPGDPWSARGIRWVPGDVHVHTEALQPDVSLTRDQILEAMEKQDLEVAAVLVWGVRPWKTGELWKAKEDWRRGGRVAHVDLETSSFAGGCYPSHVIALGLEDWHHPTWFFTHPIVQWALDQHAVVGIAHADHWPEAPGSFPRRTTEAPLDLACCLAAGQPLFLSTQAVNHAGFRRLWYQLLDCGFRVPITAGSDWPVAGRFPGEVRTWVAVPGELTYRKWAAGIGAGRTSIAEGREDRLLAWAGDALPGDELRLPEGGGEVALELESRAPRETTVEVVVNGVVHATTVLPAGEARGLVRVRVARSSWIAARTPKAHSGPLYALVGDRPIRASVASAKDELAQLDDLAEQVSLPSFGDGVPAQVESERTAALALIRKARSAFEKIRDEAERP